MKKTIPSLILLTSLAASTASAQLLLEETFDYTNGALGNTASNSLGTTGNWRLYSNNGAAGTADVISYNWLDGAGITNYGYASSSKALSGASGDAAAVDTTFDIDFDADSVYYFSLLIKDTASTNGGLIGFGSTSQNWWDIKMRMSQDVGAAVTAYIGGTVVGNMFPGVGLDALVVGRLTTSAAGNDQIETFAIGEGGTLNITSFDSNTGIVSNSAIVTGTANSLNAWNFQGNDNYIGDVRFGTTFDAVAVPEPSTYALLAGMLALGAVMIRRRR